MGLRVAFAAYSLFGAATSTLEWVARPTLSMASVMDPGVDLAGTNVVLTGGCAGIGLETARALAARGAHVAVGCRPGPPRATPTDTSAAALGADAEADVDAVWSAFDAPATPLFGSGSPRGSGSGGDLSWRVAGMEQGDLKGSAWRYPLDLSNFASVRSFAARVAADLDTVDVVIHNAGTLAACTNTTDGFEVSLPTLNPKP